jgi:hypothetical protein
VNGPWVRAAAFGAVLSGCGPQDAGQHPECVETWLATCTETWARGECVFFCENEGAPCPSGGVCTNVAHDLCPDRDTGPSCDACSPEPESGLFACVPET